MSTPRYRHDGCEKCVFLGTEGPHDLYFCPQNHMPTVVARHGNEAWAYISGEAWAVHIPALRVALERAKARGLIG